MARQEWNTRFPKHQEQHTLWCSLAGDGGPAIYGIVWCGNADVDRISRRVAIVQRHGRERFVYLDDNNIWTSVWDLPVRNVEPCEGWPEITTERLQAAI